MIRTTGMIGAALIALALSPAAAAAEIFALHTDHAGSVIMETDKNRNITWQGQYEPYGLPRQAPPEGPGYTGHVHDAASGLVYMQQRYYDPLVGRFLSVDPMAVNTANSFNFNRYNYAANNPYRYTDPDGQCAAGESERKCIHAENFDSARSSGQNARGNSETDGTARAQRNVVRTASGATRERLGSMNRQEDGALKTELIAGATTGQTETADKAFGIVPSNAEAVIHGHVSSSVKDDPASRGDADAVKQIGKPNYAVTQDGRIIVHEVVDGRYQVRMVEGKMKNAEIQHFREATSSRQEDFYDPPQ